MADQNLSTPVLTKDDPVLPRQSGIGGPIVHPADARIARRTSFDVADFEVPHGREEEWRFTPLDRLGGLHSRASDEPFDGKLVVDVDAPDGVLVAAAERGDPLLGRALAPVERVSALAWSTFEAATVVTVPRRHVAETPIVVNLRGEGGTASAHLLIDIGEQAEATVILDHTGSITLADNVEFVVGDAASLTIVSIQDWAAGTVHVSTHAFHVGRDARVKGFHVTLGGDLVRLSPTVTYAAPGGDVDLSGLYFADRGQHLEHRLFVDHAVPHCRSRVAYKGALQGEDAHTVWIGDVLIRARAEGTDTYELNRNLVLTDGARADSVPNLEIETGEIVGAGHASATGRFDDEQLFYLSSRGIPEDEARRLVVRGFFAEIIDKIGLPELQERLLAAVDAELGGVAT